MSTIKPAIRSLSDLIMPEVKVDVATGVATLPADMYERLLPEGISLDVVKAVQAHDCEIFAATMDAVGRVATPLMTEHKDLKRVSVEMGIGNKDVLKVNFDRERSFPDPKNNGVITKYGHATLQYDKYAQKSIGQVKAVREELAAQALEAFGGGAK